MNNILFKNWYVVIKCLITSLIFLVTNSLVAGTIQFNETILKNLQWRCIGPAIMGGRIDDIAVVESQPWIIYVATASGGLWKTTNNGVTWQPIFDNENTSSIGAVAVSPSDPSIVWVGTGEPNNRQSSSWGNGIYKSTDGGKTWTNMGLKESHHIGRIIIHPANPDIAYVAALGHLWGSNKERGLFMTTDGGQTWENTLFINEDTGCVDVAMDSQSPNILYAAAYQRRRTAWGFNGGGPHSGLYKSTDGGKTWIRLSNGLPSGDTGRIGISVYRKDPNIVYAIVENKDGGVFKSEDKGLTWWKVSSINPRPMYYSKIRVDPNNDQRIWVFGHKMFVSEDGGISFRTDVVDVAIRVHNDHHALWINPSNSNHMVLGGDGGIYFSYDRGKTWDFVNTLPLGQFYEIGVDMRKPYYIYGGIQDHGTWGGPSTTINRIGITNDDWFKIRRGDGFYVQVSPIDHNIIFTETANGNLFRFNLKTWGRRIIKPEPKEGEERYRFNWNSPLLISPHNPNTLYFGGNKLFKSTNQGETWTSSPDLTKMINRDELPIMGVMLDENTLSRNDGVSFYGTITTISESPIKEGLLFVGTDDGNLQVSRDGGKIWKNVANGLPNLPKGTYVTRVVASYFEEGRVYAAFDGHRNNDFGSYVYISNNYGESWKSISSSLPVGGTVNVIREHPRNQDLLFMGTERGAYVSFDRGKHWIPFKNNLPIVPVDDILIHPRENDLIFGTHGRSIWILDDIKPLEQLTRNVLESEAFLFDIRPTTIFNYHDNKAYIGNKIFVAPNPPLDFLFDIRPTTTFNYHEKKVSYVEPKIFAPPNPAFGAIIGYYLKSEPICNVKIIIMDEAGNVIQEFSGLNEAGINRIGWDLRYPPRDSYEGELFGVLGPPVGPLVPPGEYIVKLKVGKWEMAKTVRLEEDSRTGVPETERKLHLKAVLFLNKLFASANKLCKVSNDLITQLKVLKNNFSKLPSVPNEVNSAADSIARQIDEINQNVCILRNQIGQLSDIINRYDGAPTPQHANKMEIFSKKLRTFIEQMNKLIGKSIPALNKLMNENNIPQIIVSKMIKMS